MATADEVEATDDDGATMPTYPGSPPTEVLLDRISERLGSVERIVTPLGEVMERVDATLARMDGREEEKWRWQRERDKVANERNERRWEAGWRLLSQPVAIVLAVLAAYMAARFGVAIPTVPAAAGATPAPAVAPADDAPLVTR